MKPCSLLVLACWIFLIPQPALAAEPQRAFHWPNGARAAVSLAYDDALDSQLDHAIPVLDKYGLKGSFYLQLSNPSVSGRMGQWRAAAMRGHELGNHSVFHQCSRSKPDRDWVQKHRDLDTTTVEQMKDQVIVANTMLYAIDGKRERTSLRLAAILRPAVKTTSDRSSPNSWRSRRGTGVESPRR